MHIVRTWQAMWLHFCIYLMELHRNEESDPRLLSFYRRRIGEARRELQGLRR